MTSSEGPCEDMTSGGGSAVGSGRAGEEETVRACSLRGMAWVEQGGLAASSYKPGLTSKMLTTSNYSPKVTYQMNSWANLIQ